MFTPSISSPPYQILPHSLLEWMRPASAFNKVDLPWPDGASSSVVVPGLNVPDTFLKMGTSWLYPEPRPPVSIPLSMDPTVEIPTVCSAQFTQFRKQSTPSAPSACQLAVPRCTRAERTGDFHGVRQIFELQVDGRDLWQLLR